MQHNRLYTLKKLEPETANKALVTALFLDKNQALCVPRLPAKTSAKSTTVTKSLVYDTVTS